MIKSNLPTSILLFAAVSMSACSSHTNTRLENKQTVLFEDAQVQLLTDTLSIAVSSDTSDTQNNMNAQAAGRVEYLRIKGHQVECESFTVTHCLLTQGEGSDEWVIFYDQIEGFEYQWGNDYEILVQVQQVSEAAHAHSTNTRYDLIEIISQTKLDAGASFQYTSRKTHERITEVSPGLFSLLGNKQFSCTDDSCNSIRAAIDQQQSLVLSFMHNAHPSEPLILDAVMCGDAGASFTDSCL